MLETGTKAPAFELPDQNGVMHRLEDYKGKKVILYFYPKDNTPGCTKQACGYSERYPQFMEKGAVILGVSKDSVASHKRFEEKYGLAFTLLPIRSGRSSRPTMCGRKRRITGRCPWAWSAPPISLTRTASSSAPMIR